VWQFVASVDELILGSSGSSAFMGFRIGEYTVRYLVISSRLMLGDVMIGNRK
jgi:hypothetical protein